MRKEGAIRLLARGLYDYPVKHSVLGTVAPSADAIARALVGRDASRRFPAMVKSRCSSSSENARAVRTCFVAAIDLVMCSKNSV
jgi:hypothetical protein